MPSESAVRRILYPLTAAILLVWYLFFTAKSLGLYFDSDDMMNLYLAWSKPLTEVYRPVGGLFYRAMFAFAGFRPFPFRVACLVLGAANIGLCWRFARLLSGSDRAAALAALLFAFHTRLMEVWWRTAMVYDLLCSTFFYAAACLYLAPRTRDLMPGPARSVLIVLCFVCALGAKENALALPAVLLAYELLFHGARWRNVRFVILLAVLTLPYLYLKLRGPAALASIEPYASQYTLSRFTASWAHYLGFLFLQDADLDPRLAMTILFGPLALAALAKSRRLTLSWFVLFFSMLPVVFIAGRGGYVLYTGYPGAVLYVALVVVALQDRLVAPSPRYRTAVACAVFAFVAWRWGKLNLHDQRTGQRQWLYESQANVHAMVDRMRAIAPAMPRGARVLFLDDAFSTGEWTPYFVMKLLYRDDTLTPDRLKMLDNKPAGWNGYAYVFTFENGLYKRLKP